MYRFTNWYQVCVCNGRHLRRSQQREVQELILRQLQGRKLQRSQMQQQMRRNPKTKRRRSSVHLIMQRASELRKSKPQMKVRKRTMQQC